MCVFAQIFLHILKQLLNLNNNFKYFIHILEHQNGDQGGIRGWQPFFTHKFIQFHINCDEYLVHFCQLVEVRIMQLSPGKIRKLR